MPRNGFTLLELIVAMVIFSIILVMALQLASSAMNSVRISESRAFNNSVARRTFALLNSDISQMIVRDDARIEFESVEGNDKLAFLNTNRGLIAADPGERPASLVTYAIASDPEKGTQLLRGTRGHDYSDTGSNVLVLDSEKPFPAVSPDSIDPISNNVLRMEVEYLLEENGELVKKTVPPVKLVELRGLVVSLVTMDERTRRAISGSRQKSVADEFGDAVATKDTLEAWIETRNSLADSGPGGIPKDALKNIGCYQRTFLIP